MLNRHFLQRKKCLPGGSSTNFKYIWFSERITSHKEVAQELNKHSSGTGDIYHVYQTPQLCKKIFPCPHKLALRRTQSLGGRFIRAKITLNQGSNISLIPKLSNTEDANSQTGTLPYVSYIEGLVNFVR